MDDGTTETRPRGRAAGAGGITPQRLLGLVGTCALLGVAVAIALMIARTGDDEQPAERLAATATPEPTPTAAPGSAVPPLTPKQKEQRRDAVEAMAGQGFEPKSLKPYRGDRTLRALVGISTSPPYGQQAFFFVKDEYVGTDTVDTSEEIRVARNGETAVTIEYTLFAPGGVAPTGTERVRFEWDGSSLLPQDEIPPVTERGPR